MPVDSSVKLTQNERIIRHLEDYGHITSLEAISEYGIMRLASRISDLRKRGFNIRREIVEGRNRYKEVVHFAKYYLIKE